MVNREQAFSIPGQVDKFNTFNSVLVSVVQNNGVARGIPQSEIDAVVNNAKVWQPAYDACANRATNSVANRAARKAAQETTADTAALVMTKYIVGNSAITPEERAALGIHALNTSRTPMPAPSMRPELHVAVTDHSFQKLNFREAGTQGRFGKPAGVAFCEVRYQVGGTPPATAEAASLTIPLSKSGYLFKFESDQAGMTVFYFGRFVNNKGQSGGWSDMASDMIR